MGGIRKARGAYNKSEGIKGIDDIERLKNLYPVSDADVKRLVDNSKNTTKVNPDGMGKDSSAAIKEFLKNNKE
jgi:hypothetical protein